MRTKYINDIKEIERIINKCDVCYMAMADGDQPYVIPMNFAYENRILYLHSALTGKKNDILKKNKKVCITFSIDHQLDWQNEKVACSYGMKSRSVVGFGNVKIIEDYDTKIEYLNKFMKKYTGNDEFNYSKPSVNNVFVFIVKFDEISGKLLGY